MKRATVFANEEDLAIIKAAAARRGIAEAEIIRDAIHLAAMAHRTWDEPFFTHTYMPANGSPHGGATAVLDDTWTEKSQAYERTRRSAS